jgi:predicted AlkP superfamily pyrophosphatase or phosphodiesterase
MRKLLLSALLAAALSVAAPKPPKLVLTLVFDQFRYDYLTRFHGEFSAGGFDALLTRGAVFADARYTHFPTVTAVGHSTILSGATPSVSGIVGNEWYDRDEHRRVTSVADSATRLLGGTGEGSSPRRLLVDTVGDELKMAHGAGSRVIGISLKDRAAILPAGHLADGAYWFDLSAGSFVTSTFYMAQLPAWVAEFDARRPAERYASAAWLDHKLPAAGGALYRALESSPFGNDITEAFAERALEAEALGRHEATDLLSISFSAHDYVGHTYGPFSPEERAVSAATDRAVARLLAAVDRQVGLANVLVVMTADHGVAPVPGSLSPNMPGGRIKAAAVRDAIQNALQAKFGEGKWVLVSSDLSISLDASLAQAKGVTAAEMRRVAAEAAAAVPHIMRVYTRDQLETGAVVQDAVSRAVMNGFNARRAADLAVIPEPYWIVSESGTTHGSPFGYDNHVPIILMGVGIAPGHYDAPVTVNDIAPTLAAILEVETPSGSAGRVLSEALSDQPSVKASGSGKAGR